MRLMLNIFALTQLLLFVALLPVTHTLHRDEFPPEFVFGASTSAYQIEGAANEDGRKPSIWDTFAHAGNGNLYEGDGDVACDHYHKYKEDVQLMANLGLEAYRFSISCCYEQTSNLPFLQEDVQLMANLGLEAYRFSISWSRLIPDGRGQVNPKGLQYYNNLINELIRHGIQPHVTLYHWDLPQTLEDEYGGWISQRIVKDYTTYADVCFREFGDRVKYWTTVNEANICAIAGYDRGALPPQRCSSYINNCSRGNSSTEPYLAAHHMLLAHASAVRLYKNKYKDMQHGFVGFNLLTFGFIPHTNTSEDISATKRTQDFYNGWFLNPFTFGDYPDTMKKKAGSRLPSFTQKESNMVKGSIDFLGINFYYTHYVKNSPGSLGMEDMSYHADLAVELLSFPQDDTYDYEIPITTWSLQGVLDSLKNAYGNIPIYIHENGQKTLQNSSLDDWSRVKYLQAYVGSMLDALRSGSYVKGYFVWSFLDSLELLSGYESSFGLYYIDMNDSSLRRQPKLSANWYSHFLNGKSLDPMVNTEIETPLMHYVA